MIKSSVSFKKSSGDNPLVSLGVGKVSLITKWLDKMEIENYTINDDYTIDVDGRVNLYDRNLDKFPDYIQFNKVIGYFNCSHNQLTNLRGCPIEVFTSFNCSYNFLTSLSNCPKVVSNGSFHCHHNEVEFTLSDIKILCKINSYIQNF
jgi:hypothetical protein